MARWIGFLLLVALQVTAAQGAPALPSFDFEQGTDGWVSMAATGKVSTVTQPENVRSGKQALEYRYKVERGEIPVLGFPTPEGLAGLKSLQLDVKSDSPTVLLVALAEEGGARYQYASATPAGWLHLSIDLSEFARADDAPDPNGKLDLDQVRYVAFADLMAVWTNMDENMANILGRRTGEHAFWLDNVTASEKPVLPPSPPGQVVIDDFRTENLGWLPLAGVSIAVGPAPAGGEGRALRVEYQRTAGKISGIVRMIQPGSLARAQSITLKAAAKVDTTLAVAVEEIGGARYMTAISLAGGAPPQAFTIPINQFTLTEDTKDADGRLDPDQIKSISFADLAAMIDPGATGKNTLWLQQVRAQVATGALQGQ